MIILVLDTSSSQGLVALKTPQGVKTLKNSNQLEHNRFILPAIDALLKDANLKLSDIDYFAASVGPGSFVGTRLAVAVTQGLAFGTQKPVVAISHLALIAKASKQEIVILDAKMQGFYRYNQGQEEFHRFEHNNRPAFTPIPIFEGEYLIELAEREIKAGRILKNPALLQPTYLHDEDNWKKKE